MEIKNQDFSKLNNIEENPKFITEQIITYLGNKRTLISHIEEEVIRIKKELKKEKIDCVDLFSGSGVVARMLKKHSNLLITNDLEGYSEIINKCYLTNKSDFDEDKYNTYLEKIHNSLNKGLKSGIITKNYAPEDDSNIKTGERVFYTTSNAKKVDTIRATINEIEEEYQKFFLAPLLYKASVHTNTGGVFKGFYKDSTTGKGKYGGNGENALSRIKGDITLEKPVFSNFDCTTEIYREDANELVKKLRPVDVVYIDPPYNQHPYGANYFMLNVILNEKLDTEKISEVSGIPNDWNRSRYNKRKEVLVAFDELIRNTNSSYVVISYNSEGFISFEDMKEVLCKYGQLEIKEINYNAYRASRNLKNRELYVNEYIFTLKKGV